MSYSDYEEDSDVEDPADLADEVLVKNMVAYCKYG